MKAKFIRDMEMTHPDLQVSNRKGELNLDASAAKLRALMDEYNNGQIDVAEYDKRRKVTVAKGYVFEHPLAWVQVRLGNAEPADKECLNRIEAFKKKMPDYQAGAERTLNAQLTGDPSLDAAPGDMATATGKRSTRKKASTK